jgi:ABC-type molybdate transport system substrate-binding protein
VHFMRRILTIIAVFALCLPAWAEPVAKTTAPANLTILADESILQPMARVARAYASKTKTPLTVVALNATDAEHQIEQGIEAHGVVSSNKLLMGRLSEQGMTDVSSRRPVLRTQLALVTTSDLSKQADIAQRISFASILAATPTLPIFYNEPASADGALVKKLGSEGEFATILAARLSEKPNLEDVIAALRDEPSLALILAADAVAEPDIRVLSLLPESISQTVTFEVVVLGSESMQPARAFSNFLMTREAQMIFENFGYQPATR